MQNSSLLNKFYADSSVIPTADLPGSPFNTTTLIACLIAVLVALLGLIGAIRRYFDALTAAVTQAAILFRLGVARFQTGDQNAPRTAAVVAPIVTVEISTPDNATDTQRLNTRYLRQTRLKWSRETRI